MILFKDQKFCKSILDIAQAYGPYSFWTDNLRPGMNPDATWRALMVVAALKDPLFAEPCRGLLREPDSRVRAWACTALAELNYRPAFADILAMIIDPSNRVRYHARQAAAAMQGDPPRTHYVHRTIPGLHQQPLVLISEDDPTIIQLNQRFIRRMGCLVEFAVSEEKTVELALQMRPQVIITDNQKAPDNLSGLNMTWDICRRKELRNTLLFMITVDLVEPIFLWSGGDAYFSKPHNLTILGRTLEDYLI